MEVVQDIPIIRPGRDAGFFADGKGRRVSDVLKVGTRVKLSRECEDTYSIVYLQKSKTFRLVNGIPKKYLTVVAS